MDYTRPLAKQYVNKGRVMNFQVLRGGLSARIRITEVAVATKRAVRILNIRSHTFLAHHVGMLSVAGVEARLIKRR